VRIVSIFIIMFLFSSLLLAKREHPEKWYQQKWWEEQKGRARIAIDLKVNIGCPLNPLNKV